MEPLRNIISFLESFAPLSYQESYDNAGLITGNPAMMISGALICLDSTEEVINEAIRHNCNLVIAHHPIVFGGLKKITGKNYVERAIIKAIKNDIAIYAIHTNLDNVSGGVNKKICDRLGLVNCKILSPKTGLLRKLVTFSPHKDADKVRSALFDAGAGHIGNYDQCSFNLEGTGTFRGSDETNPHVGEKGKQHHEPETRIEVVYESQKEKAIISALLAAHPYEEVAYDCYPLANTYQNAGSGMIGELKNETDEKSFLSHIKKTLNTGCIRHTKLSGKPVKSIAVCGGAGSFLLNDAIGAGAQFFITADFKYHQFFDADGKIVIADAGHYETEQFTMELIHDLLKEKFSTFAPRLTGTLTNPINYF